MNNVHIVCLPSLNKQTPVKMDAKIATLNWDLNWFLSNLKAFHNSVNVTNNTSLQLFDETLKLIRDVIDSSKTINAVDAAWPVFDGQTFSTKRFLFCGICKVQFPANRVDYNSHLASSKHNCTPKRVNDAERVADDDNDSVDFESNDGSDSDETVVEDDWRFNRWALDESKSIIERTRQTQSPGRTSIFNDTSSMINFPSNPAAKENPSVSKPRRMSSGSTGQSSPFKTQNNGNRSMARFDDNSKKPHRKQPTRSEIGERIAYPKLDRINTNPPIFNDDLQATKKVIHLRAFFEGDLNCVISSAITERRNFSKHASHVVVSRSMHCLLEANFPQMECKLIGSRVNGYSNDKNAALDIYLELEKRPHGNRIVKRFTNHLTNVQRLLMDSNTEWSHVSLSFSGQAVHLARYGILSAHHIPTNLDCRFVLGSDAFVRNNDAIQRLFDMQKESCLQLVLCIRLSMKELKDPNWTTKFSGYIISLLVIYYFQVTRKLPPIKELGQPDHTFEYPPIKERLSALIIGFFKFYSKFEFEEKIISVVEGCSIHRSFHDSTNQSLIGFKWLMQSDPMKWQKTNMCVQDPYLHSNNVTSSIKTADIDNFKQYCEQSFNILTSSRKSLRF